MLDNFLEHFGVKGMKWGIRKDRKGSGKKTAEQTAKTLTNKELKKRVDRMNLEKQYASLAKKSEVSSKSKGKKIVDEVLADYGGRVVRGLTKKGAEATVTYVAEKAPELAQRRRGG
jgi:hypothetical protein